MPDLQIYYPYRMKIDSKESAVYAIKNMCNNCENFTTCTGEMSARCNIVKEKIASFAKNNLQNTQNETKE